MTIDRPFYDYPPALGWQTIPYVFSETEGSLVPADDNASCGNAHNYYLNVINEVDVQKLMDRVDEIIQASNRDKLFGYIPVVGTVIGAKRIISTIKDKSLPIKNKVVHILRGSVEFLSLGFLLIIPDFILSKCRNFHSKLWPATDLNPSDSDSDLESL